MKVELDNLGSPSPIVRRASVGVKATYNSKSCMKVDVDVPGSPSLTVCTVPVNVEQQRTERTENPGAV